MNHSRAHRPNAGFSAFFNSIQDLSQRITASVMAALGSTSDEVSVAIEDVPRDDWMTAVYEPEIAARPTLLFKRPGYGSLA